jgi:hypothetical protein
VQIGLQGSFIDSILAGNAVGELFKYAFPGGNIQVPGNSGWLSSAFRHCQTLRLALGGTHRVCLYESYWDLFVYRFFVTLALCYWNQVALRD